MSASVGQHSGSGWSPTTTRSTGFNIDDYVSSDDDSFITTTKKRPTAEGEEELLFKGSYGATGAELPGLLESMIMGASCSPPPSRVVGFRGATSQLLSSPSPLAEEAEDGEYDDDAAEGPDIDDIRPVGRARGQPFTPPFSQTQHPHSDQYRNSVGGKQTAKPRAQSNITPSWLPSDNWVLRPGSRLSQVKRPTTSSSTTSNTGPVSSEDNNTHASPTSRGQSRLSAFGTLPLRNLVAADTEGVKRTNGAGSSSITSNSSKEPATNSSSKEETDPAVLAVRLRKEAKSRKREEEARTIREKRMTRAFGRVDEDALAALEEQDDGEMETRGRTRVRIPKGKSVMIAS